MASPSVRPLLLLGDSSTCSPEQVWAVSHLPQIPKDLSDFQATAGGCENQGPALPPSLASSCPLQQISDVSGPGR